MFRRSASVNAASLCNRPDFDNYPPQRRLVAQTGTPFIGCISSLFFITKVRHGRPATFLPSTHLNLDFGNRYQIIKGPLRLLLCGRTIRSRLPLRGITTRYLPSGKRPKLTHRRLHCAPTCFRNIAAKWSSVQECHRRGPACQNLGASVPRSSLAHPIRIPFRVSCTKHKPQVRRARHSRPYSTPLVSDQEWTKRPVPRCRGSHIREPSATASR